MSAPWAFASLSYDHLSVRCLMNFIIFLGADALSQSIERTVRRRRRRRRRKKNSIVVDLDDFNNLDADLTSSLSSSSSSSSSVPFSGRARSVRFALFGALVHAPACSLFFGALDARLPGKGWREVCLKLAADRATLAPALLLAALVWMRVPVSLLLLGKEDNGYSSVSSSSSAPAACLETLYEQGKAMNDDKTTSSTRGDIVAAAAENALRRLPRAYALSCLFWVPAHSLGFAAVPPRWRVLYVALASLVWNCVLARISSEPVATTAREEEEEEEEERRRRQRRQKQQQRRGLPSSSSSNPASSLPLFTKRQTRKARWSGSETAAASD